MSDSTPPPNDPDEAPQERPLTLFSAAIWVLIAMLVEALGAQISESLREGAQFDPVTITGCRAVAYSVVLFGVLRLHAPQGSIRHILALRPPPVLAIVLGLAVGAALALPSDWFARLLEPHFAPASPESQEAVDTIFSAPTIGKRIGIFVSFVVVEPVLTELFFRGVIFTPLRPTHRTDRVIVAITVFQCLGTLMGSPRLMFALMAAMLVFTWIRGVTGSVWPAIAAHVAFNSVDIVPTILGKPEIEPTRTLLIASGAVALTSLIGMSFLARTDRAITARQQDAGEVPL